MTEPDPPTVLVVDDDPAIITALERGLRLEGFAVHTATAGLDAVRRVGSGNPDVVVLDLGLPDIDGVEVIRRLRADAFGVPICVLSARDEIPDRVEGLEAGADDYLIKPFALPELVARLRALLRRGAEPAAHDAMRAGDVLVDPARRVARRGDHELDLTRREFDLLEVLVAHAGLVLSRAQLLELVWGYDWEVDSNVVDVFVGYLRKKLEAHGEPRVIQTVRGIGFKLVVDA